MTASDTLLVERPSDAIVVFRLNRPQVRNALNLEVRVRLADDMKHSLRLKLGIRWLPPRFDRPSGRPDLNQMERREPARYGALWRGTLDARVGKGALGRRTIDRAVRFASTRDDVHLA